MSATCINRVEENVFCKLTATNHNSAVPFPGQFKTVDQLLLVIKIQDLNKQSAGKSLLNAVYLQTDFGKIYFATKLPLILNAMLI